MERESLPVLDGPAFEVELPTGELLDRRPLPVLDDDDVSSYSSSSSSNNGTRARVLALPFDRGKRLQENAKHRRITLGLTYPFDRGKDLTSAA